jgi:hypothetical protein
MKPKGAVTRKKLGNHWFNIYLQHFLYNLMKTMIYYHLVWLKTEITLPNLVQVSYTKFQMNLSSDLDDDTTPQKNRRV